MRVLIADDDAEVARLVADCVTGVWPGCAVTIAPDGREALRRFAAEAPDSVLLDVAMPPPDGLAVCRRIRLADPAVPILLLTGRGAALDEPGLHRHSVLVDLERTDGQRGRHEGGFQGGHRQRQTTRPHLAAAVLLPNLRQCTGRAGEPPQRVNPNHWQAKERTGFALEHFRIDWDQQQRVPARGCCPEGHSSNSWTPAVDRRDNRVIKIKFSGRDCRRCPSRDLCTRSTKKYPRRTITIRAREEFDALLAARQRVRMGEYATTDARRVGCEV